jgi:hypothetical protein
MDVKLGLQETPFASAGERTPVVRCIVKHYTAVATPAPIKSKAWWKADWFGHEQKEKLHNELHNYIQIFPIPCLF